MADLMEAVTSLAKRRGIAFQSSEIYGGLRSSWDYGPLGVELRRNIRNAWWRSMVQLRDDDRRPGGGDHHVAEGLGGVRPRRGLPRPARRVRELPPAVPRGPPGPSRRVCPNCGGTAFTEPRHFNLMFKTHMGPVEDDDRRRRTCAPRPRRGCSSTSRSSRRSSRKKLPFGIAQIGKSFRNEITPGNFIFRTREFEQMEMEFFVEPGTDDEWFDYWVNERLQWYLDLGVPKDKLRLRPHEPDELAHYAKAATDVEYEFPFGWSELEGIANRTDFDLQGPPGGERSRT